MRNTYFSPTEMDDTADEGYQNSTYKTSILQIRTKLCYLSMPLYPRGYFVFGVAPTSLCLLGNAIIVLSSYPGRLKHFCSSDGIESSLHQVQSTLLFGGGCSFFSVFNGLPRSVIRVLSMVKQFPKGSENFHYRRRS